MNESPGLKPDWFGEISRSQWNIQTDYYLLNAQKSSHKWEVEILAYSSLKSAHHFPGRQEPLLPISIHWKLFVFDARLED